jgi:hypothetical protein
MVFCCVKDFLARRRSVNPAQAWTNSICRSMRWHVLPRLLKAEIGTNRTNRAGLAMSVVLGNPEVAFRSHQGSFWHETDMARHLT